MRNSLLCLGCGWLVVALTIGTANAETWSDASGQFQIEAEFIGVEGRSIRLRKAGGAIISVPIDKLSPESRALAKRLYEASLNTKKPRSEPGQAAADAPGLQASTPTQPVNFEPPTPPPVPPAKPFPENPTLQQTVDFCRAELLAGHPEVFWQAIPEEIRQAIDSPELRGKLNPVNDATVDMTDAVTTVWYQVIEILINQKRFVLNSQFAAMIPPPFVPTVQQAYDPAVGLAYELFEFFVALDYDRSFGEHIDQHGPRVGAHLSALTKVMPPGLLDQVTTLEVEQSGSDSGTITWIDPDGQPQTLEMAKLAGRWIPKAMADTWPEAKQRLTEGLDQQMDVPKFGDTMTEPEMAEFKTSVLTSVQAIEQALLPLREAETQEEFDMGLALLNTIFAMLGQIAEQAAP